MTELIWKCGGVDRLIDIWNAGRHTFSYVLYRSGRKNLRIEWYFDAYLRLSDPANRLFLGVAKLPVGLISSSFNGDSLVSELLGICRYQILLELINFAVTFLEFWLVIESMYLAPWNGTSSMPFWVAWNRQCGSDAIWMYLWLEILHICNFPPQNLK